MNNRLIVITKNLSVMMPVHSLLEYSENYSKISEILWYYCRDEPNGKIADSFKFN